MNLNVLVQPNSKVQKAEFVGNELKIWIKAKPIEGEANSEIIRFLKKQIKKITGTIPELTIVRGHKNRHKIIHITGIPLEFQNPEAFRNAFTQ